MKVASSFISLEQAELNLERELGTDTFEDTKRKAREEWNEKLSRIEIESNDIDKSEVFTLVCIEHFSSPINSMKSMVQMKLCIGVRIMVKLRRLYVCRHRILGHISSAISFSKFGLSFDQ